MRRLLLFAAALAACQSGASRQQPDGGAPPGGHALPRPGFAAAWKVQDAGELIGGPSTAGRAGDWELANARVRFIVEDARPSDGFDPYGCSIAAADRQRAPGEPGESRWGELWLGFNFRAPGCDAISVINDGSDGSPAVIRAVGPDAESPFMASLFSVSPQPLHATIFREYSLAPDSGALRMNLTIRNDGDAALDINAPYAGMAMNRGLRHWVNRSGFDLAGTWDSLVNMNVQADFYAAVGEKISYSVLELNAPFSPIFDVAHVLIGQYPQVHIPAGQSSTFRFAFAVGAGDAGTLQAAHQELLGNASGLVTLSGSVVDASDRPVAGARVHVTDTTGQEAVSFARTAAGGAWVAAVRPGSYLARALADDRPGSPVQALAVPPAGLTGVKLALGAQSTVLAAATDEAGNPLPAKIVLGPDPQSPRPSLPASLGEMWDRQPIVVFSADGRATVPVFPGTWRVTFSRGFEYDLPVRQVIAPPGGSVAATAVLRRVVDTAGWVSGDFHVHAQFSPDGDDLMSLKVRAFAAEGVEVPVSTEHEFIGDFGPTAAALGLASFMHTIPGTEMTTTATGHFNIFPLAPLPGQVNAGAFRWFGRTIPEVIAEARARLTRDGGVPIVQMNHPRAAGMDYLGAVGFDPGFYTVNRVQDFMTSWDAMEVWNGTPLPSFEGCPNGGACVKPAHPTAFDWFSFLNRGLRITGTGNSDSHRAETRAVGYPRTYLQAGSDDPALVSDAQVSAALRAMRATISGGIFLTISTPDAEIGGVAHAGGTGLIHLRVRAQAPTWMGPLARVDLWVGDATAANGARLTQIPLTDPATQAVRYDATVDVPVAADTWVIATARGTGTHALWPVVQDPVPPFAITNPIWIKAN